MKVRHGKKYEVFPFKIATTTMDEAGVFKKIQTIRDLGPY